MLHFTLFYRGQLKANGKPKHKHALREAFHCQLAEMWAHPPVNQLTPFLRDNPVLEGRRLVQKVESYRVVPLVSKSLGAVAELDIFMLRPGAIGEILKGGGDIDNRLKTLFDALTVPRKDQLRGCGEPKPDQTPFYCLLEDDKLISAVRVETAQFLVPNIPDNEVALFIRVTVRSTHAVKTVSWLG